MPAPTDPPYEWATDTNYPAGASPWSGQPTKNEPNAAKQASGWVPATAPPADEMNFILANHGAWLEYLAGSFAEVERTRYLPIHFARPGAGGHDPGAWAYNTPGGHLTSTADGAFVLFDVNAYIPRGAEITLIEASLNLGAARTGGDAPFLQLLRQTYPSTVGAPSTAVVATDTLDGGAVGATLAELDLSGSPVLVAPNVGLSLLFRAGIDSPHLGDQLHWARVTYTMPEGIGS